MSRSQAVVVFVDDIGWASFDQVAVALKRRGVRVVRVVTRAAARFSQMLAEPHLRWAADRLFYDEVISLSREGASGRLLELLEGGPVLDVIATEPMLRGIGLQSELGRALVRRSLSFSGAPPEVLLDKFTINARLAEAGVAIPRQAWAHELSAGQAAETFGLPLVIKRPLGAGGEQVRIARSASEVERALNELASNEEPLFYQEHIPGKVVVYGAVVGPDGPVIEHGFRIEQVQHERGPAASAAVYDTPGLLAAGRRAVDVFRPQGFASFGFIEAADGRLLHIDANLRPWGMIAVALPLGIDFVGAYAEQFVGARPRRAKLSPPGALPVYPHAILDAAQKGGPADLWAASASLAPYARGLGLPYCAQTLAQALLLVGRRVRRRRPSGFGVVEAAPALSAASSSLQPPVGAGGAGAA